MHGDVRCVGLLLDGQEHLSQGTWWPEHILGKTTGTSLVRSGWISGHIAEENRLQTTSGRRGCRAPLRH